MVAIHTPESSEAPVILPATPELLEELAPNLREPDKAEAKALLGLSPAEGLQISLSASLPGTAYVATLRGCVVCAWGLGEAISLGVGHPWLMASSALSEITVPFLRRSRRVVSGWLDICPILTNVVDDRNHLHRKWLHWLGFQSVRKLPAYGADQIPFTQFIKVKPCASLWPPLRQL